MVTITNHPQSKISKMKERVHIMKNTLIRSLTFVGLSGSHLSK